MNEDDTKRPEANGSPATPPQAKLPYERPAVISDEVFETLALSCAQSPFGCGPGSSSS